MCFSFSDLKELGFAGKATDGWRWEKVETFRDSDPTPITPLNADVAVVAIWSEKLKTANCLVRIRRNGEVFTWEFSKDNAFRFFSRLPVVQREAGEEGKNDKGVGC